MIDLIVNCKNVRISVDEEITDEKEIVKELAKAMSKIIRQGGTELLAEMLFEDYEYDEEGDY